MFPSVISREKAIEKIIQVNCINWSSKNVEPFDLVIAEYLRKTLYNIACANSPGTNFEPTYITRLTNSVRRQLSPLWPNLNLPEQKRPCVIESQTQCENYLDHVRRILESLSDLRDVIELDNGYWLPTPLRLIQLPEREKVFIIGGGATSELQNKIKLGTEVKYSGLIRYLERKELPKQILEDKAWWQSYEDWLGTIPKDIRDWTKASLTDARQRLSPSASNLTNFEVYFPPARGNSLQYFRWIHFEDLSRTLATLPGDVVLCRTVLQGFQINPTKYWFGTIAMNGLKTEAPVLQQNIRRLLYGLDLIYNSPTQAFLEPDGVIILKNWLPPEERRLFLALGQDVSPNPDRLPLNYRFNSEWQEFIISVLKNLGIRILEKEDRYESK